MKRVLGLDLGTNSIGWALVEQDFEKKQGEIIGIGSRIIPMSQDVLDKFGQGQSHSQTADRTVYRSVRRLRQRHLLRRERLHRVLYILNSLPKHYANSIDFVNKKGQFVNDIEVKLNYKEINSKKFEFLFKDSFNEMVSEFEKSGQEIRIPYDWTIYYLRKKALKEKISLQELAWILLNFNQKRGYYQLRGEEEEEDKSKLIEFHALKVVDVSIKDETDTKTEVWYNVKLENNWIYPRKSKTSLNDWIGKTKEFIVTTPVDEEGNPKKDKDGNINRSFRAPKEDDWTLIKTKTQNEIEKFNNLNSTIGVGTYIYHNLLKNPKQKINGKLIRTIERHFYKDELISILEKQKEFHPELKDKFLLEKCILELYPNNYAQQNILKQTDFTNLFVNDIIYHQRPLKSKKSLIDGCKYESRRFKNKDGEIETKALKVIHKSHPLFQEFRLWQFVDNIRIYQREKMINGKLIADVDVTTEYIPDEDAKVGLFDFFNDKAKIKQKTFLSNFKDVYGKRLDDESYRWSYVEDKEYPLNETRAHFISRFKKVDGFTLNEDINIDFEIKLWHIIYSVKDKKQYIKALETFASKNKIDKTSFVEAFKNFKPFSNEYGALSEKAIKKLLPLMRMGKYWNYNNIDNTTRDRVQKIINGEFDDKIRDRVREKAINLQTENDFRALPLWLASYIVYDRHSESSDNTKWDVPQQLDEFIKEFKQHSLRNPIVEQVITETLRVVRDIWEYYGSGKKNFFDEIHIELGRDMKNPADKRKKMTAQIIKNQDTNERIRNLLREFKAEKIEGVIPYSPSQQEKLKIFEEDILNQYSEKDLDKEVYEGVNIGKIAKTSEPTVKEIQKYKLWLEQKYRSPYTGQVIPLSKLFTSDYEIEHVIPQARYFDDSFGNKVICETEVNKTKGNQTAFEFLSKNPGLKIDLGKGYSATLFDLKTYQNFVSENFKKGSKKFKFLLSEDVPEQFVSRQLNDTRYISKVVKGLLSNIVRSDDEQEATSKNVVSVTGAVTTILKKDWGLEDKWNEIVLPRFQRLNKITGTNDYTYFNEKINKELPNVPKDLKKGFNRKRIDHRHHAMDALTVALATRSHISYLGNEHTKSDNKRYDLRNKLRRVEEIQVNGKLKKVSKEFYAPWRNFPLDAKRAIENIIVSFKQNLRVINKASNKYQVRKNGLIETKIQEGTNWAIRKPMHKETVYGKVNLKFKKTVNLNSAIDGEYIFVDKELNNTLKKLTKDNLDNKQVKKFFKDRGISKVEVFYYDDNYAAVRKPVDENFKSKKWIEESVTDKGIQKILINHLEKYNEAVEGGKIKERPDLAFSSVGLEDMNKNILELNNSKPHQPIYKARVYETLGNKFSVSENINSAKSKKFVEAAQGTNLFFAIYEGENDKNQIVRAYDTIPLNIVIERQKLGYSSVPETYSLKGKLELNLVTYLSPNDLVYVPTDEEMVNINSIDFSEFSIAQKKRIYKMVSSSKTQSFFVRNDIATSIQNKREFGSLNKEERDIKGNMIKERCIKLNVDRLGNTSKA